METNKLKPLLYDFVKRVTKGEITNDKEVEILPEVAKILLEMEKVAAINHLTATTLKKIETEKI